MPAVNPALFPSHFERLIQDARLEAMLAEVNQRVAAGPVTPTIDLGAFKSELAGFDFQHPRQLEDVLGWTIARLEQGLVHLNQPRYLGLFNPAPTDPAQ